MALLAEELVEEWLNRHGYFTIRGAKVGVHEMDLLAIRPSRNGIDCRHVEVHASIHAVGYIASVSSSVQRSTGRKASSMKTRNPTELRNAVVDWVKKKYDHPSKRRLRESLAPGPWSKELVVHSIKHKEELELIRAEGVQIHQLGNVVHDLLAARTGGKLPLEKASGEDLVNLVLLAAGDQPKR